MSFSIVYCYNSIFSISFSQEEQIHNFMHLLRIRSLKTGVIAASLKLGGTTPEESE